jgi:GTPase
MFLNNIKELEKEKEYGNVEYKQILTNKDSNRIEGITSQMRYRIEQGGGEAIYVIGVSDLGVFIGVNDDEFNESFNNLKIASEKNSCSISKISEKELTGNGEKKIYELLIREKNDKKYIDIKVCVAGSVDSGKSTLLGSLITGKNDDGRGSARLSVFNFKHEIASGRTSSIAHHILGFNDKGSIVNYSGNYNKSWPDIVKESSKVISLYDLCGHEIYRKTTILGLASIFPDLCIIIIGANMGITHMTKEHIALCVTLNIPFVIVVTKIDICKNRKNILDETTISINKLCKLPGLRRIPYKINNLDDVILCAKNIHTDSIVPLFYISSVTGIGLDFVKQFLNLSGKSKTNLNKHKTHVEYHVDSIFSVPGVGTVIGGQLISGIITVGDKLFLGPNNGKYETVQIKSIQCKKIPMQYVNHGSYVCLCLRKVDRKNIRRGNVLLSMEITPIATLNFEAQINILKTHSTTIKIGYEPIIYVNTSRQPAKLIAITNKIDNNTNKILDINDRILRSGDKAIATFQFKCRSEYIKCGNKILITEGRVKIIGIITKILL